MTSQGSSPRVLLFPLSRRKLLDPSFSLSLFSCKIPVFLNISNFFSRRTLGNFNASLNSLLSLCFSLMCRLSCAWYFPQKTHGRFGFLYFSTWKKIILTFMIDCTDKIFLNKMYHYLYIIIIIPLPLFKILKQLK